jgi:hypothetical protein
MELPQAKKLQRRIQADGIHCIVPLSKKNRTPGVAGYYCRIFPMDGELNLMSEADYDDYVERRRKERLRMELLSRPRSALDILIDRACGIQD